MESIYSRPIRTPDTIPVTPPAPGQMPMNAPAPAGMEPSVYVPMGGPDLPKVPHPTERSVARTSPLAWILFLIVAAVGAGFYAWRAGYVQLPEALKFLDTNVSMPAIYPVEPYAERRPEVLEVYEAYLASTTMASSTATTTTTSTAATTTATTTVAPAPAASMPGVGFPGFPAQ